MELRQEKVLREKEKRLRLSKGIYKVNKNMNSILLVVLVTNRVYKCDINEVVSV
jgi:hypothetical protein